MPLIEYEHDPLFCLGKCEDIRIRERLSSPATLRSRQDVMTEAPQDLHDWQGKIFVAVALRHASRRFVRKNVVLDLLVVHTGIGPSISQILGSQRRIAAQEIGLTRAKTFCLD